MCFNRILSELDGNPNGGPLHGDSKITAVAFADDEALIIDNPAAMFPIVTKTSTFLGDRGMQLNPKKCTALVRECVQRSIATRSSPLYELNGDKICQNLRN